MDQPVNPLKRHTNIPYEVVPEVVEFLEFPENEFGASPGGMPKYRRTNPCNMPGLKLGFHTFYGASMGDTMMKNSGMYIYIKDGDTTSKKALGKGMAV
ncbi:MAG TPA: hypothetical protein VKN36_13615 [Eudoraea sp.]|nr:hypothetical protein [Eudoraea sp.]